jgi:hypothetical protein
MGVKERDWQSFNIFFSEKNLYECLFSTMSLNKEMTMIQGAGTLMSQSQIDFL